jgi:hypothetical protein
MVLRGFGNTPVNGDMFIPPGVTPPITDVTYAGTYPLRHYLTNPPITTPEFPSNPPRATNKAPVRAFAPYDRLTNTRATTAQLGSLRGAAALGALPAGAYSGAVGRVVRVLDPDTGAGLRGQMLHTRLHGYDAPPAHLHGAHGAYLHGLGAMPEALELKQAIPQDVADVARFTIADTRTVKGQLVGTRLVLVGVKEGSTKVEVEDTSGTRSVIGLTVKGLLPAEQMAVAQQTFNEIKSLTGSRPDLRIDWQDADVLRANYDLIYPILRKLFATARDLGAAPNTYRPERYQALQLLRILVNAKSRPDLKTLREVVFSTPSYTESGTSISVPTPATATTWSTSSRECTVEGGVRYRKLYAFARDYTTFVDITNAALKITEIVGKVWSMFDPATGKIISDGAKAAAAIAAPAMAEFARSPKSLVADFGGAVCLAVAGGTAAMPVTVRAASELRKRAWLANQRYKLLKAAGRSSGVGALPATAEEARQQAQEALAKLETLDTPGAFTPAENAQIAEVRAEVNAGTSLGPSRNGGDTTEESKGIPGWVWGAGALAVIGGVLLLRKG